MARRSKSKRDSTERRWDRARRILADHEGVWCAWCGGYVEDAENMELHHVLGYKADVKKRFGTDGWVVPVHVTPESRAGCHLGTSIQASAYTAGDALLRASFESERAFDRKCSAMFSVGYLPGSLLLRRHAWRCALRQRRKDLAREHLIFGLICAAGCGIGREFIAEFERSASFQELVDDAAIRINHASAKANHGDNSFARNLGRSLSGEVRRVRPSDDPLYAKAIRMEAYLDYNKGAAKEAITLACDSPDPVYHRRTSRLALAAVHYHHQEPRRARAQADELGLDIMSYRASWWHRIEHLLYSSISELTDLDTLTLNVSSELSIVKLIQAQYASAFLDFVGIPVPDFRVDAAVSPPSWLSPTDVIRWFGRELKIPRAQMIELRNRALFAGSSRPSEEGTFKSQVLATITMQLPELTL